MAAKTKTVEPTAVDTDGDGQPDVTVSAQTTVAVEPLVTPAPLVSPTPPGCGATPCSGAVRKKATFTNSNVGRTYTFTPTNFKGSIAWDFGDGSPVVVGMGPVSHTYASAGARTVKAYPVASSVRLPSDGVAITVA